MNRRIRLLPIAIAIGAIYMLTFVVLYWMT